MSKVIIEMRRAVRTGEDTPSEKVRMWLAWVLGESKALEEKSLKWESWESKLKIANEKIAGLKAVNDLLEDRVDDLESQLEAEVDMRLKEGE